MSGDIANRAAENNRAGEKHCGRKPLRASECPVARQAMRTRITAKALAISLKQLKRMMRRCQDCAAADDCPAMLEFNRAFKIALEEINAEWDQGAASEYVP